MLSCCWCLKRRDDFCSLQHSEILYFSCRLGWLAINSLCPRLFLWLKWSRMIRTQHRLHLPLLCGQRPWQTCPGLWWQRRSLQKNQHLLRWAKGSGKCSLQKSLKHLKLAVHRLCKQLLSACLPRLFLGLRQVYSDSCNPCPKNLKPV